MLAVLIVTLLLLNYRYGLFKKKRKLEEMKERQPLEKMQKLEKELKALEEAYSSKFISEESFKKEKARIEAELKKARK